MKHLKRLGAGLFIFGVLAVGGVCCFSFALLWQYAIKTHTLVPYLAGTIAFILGAYGLGAVLQAANGDES